MLEQLAGTHLRVVFNVLTPCVDAALRAVGMALAMQAHLEPLRTYWRAQQYPVEVRVGIAQGEATLGLLRCAEQLGCTVLGPVTEAAAQLCDVAQDGQILVHLPLWETVAGHVEAVPVAVAGHAGDVELGVVMQVLKVSAAP